MATRNVTLTGLAQWARVFEDNRDMTGYKDAYVHTDGACTLQLVLSDTEFAKLKAAGSAKRGNKTDDGDTQVKLERKFSTGMEWADGAPKVNKPDGTAWDYKSDGPIPNDSIVEVDVSVYDTRYDICGTRLDTVRVMSVADMPAMASTDDTKIPF